MSIVPDAVAAVYALVRAAVPVDVPVSVGMPPGGDVPQHYVAVAYAGSDRPGVSGADDPRPGDNTGVFSVEDFEVWCTVSTASGDQNAVAQMAKTDALYQAIRGALRGSPSLSGLLANGSVARLSSYEWFLEDGGQIATVFFSVRVIARWLT